VRWKVAGSGEANRRRLLLADTKLRTERIDEKCGKGLWGRRGWCVVPFIGSREVRGQRRPATVGFELVDLDIDSGRGVDGAPS
jgi:hypothetical protein